MSEVKTEWEQKVCAIFGILDGMPFEKCMSVLARCHADALNQFITSKNLEHARQVLDVAKSQILTDLNDEYKWS